MATSDTTSPDLRRRHLRLGWWCLAVFLAMGMLLEGLHGFKVDWYLDVGHETRRMMWTLSHAHGTLLGLVNLAFAAVPSLEPGTTTWRRASALLVGGTLLLPVGFFLGGIRIYGGDPGLGVLLVPVGGLCLVLGVGMTAWQIQQVQAQGGEAQT